MKKKPLIKTFLVLFLMFFCSKTFSQSDVFNISRTGTVEQMEMLYQKDSTQINQKNQRGFTPLTLACYNNNKPVVLFLVDKVSSLNDNSMQGTPLMAATYKGFSEITDVLITHGVNVNAPDANGTTAAHYAVMFKHYEIIKQLYTAKADFTLKDQNGKTALDYAKMYNDNQINNILNL